MYKRDSLQHYGELVFSISDSMT